MLLALDEYTNGQKIYPSKLSKTIRSSAELVARFAGGEKLTVQ